VNVRVNSILATRAGALIEALKVAKHRRGIAQMPPQLKTTAEGEARCLEQCSAASMLTSNPTTGRFECEPLGGFLHQTHLLLMLHYPAHVIFARSECNSYSGLLRESWSTTCADFADILRLSIFIAELHPTSARAIK
jgi:hypothetical protein